MQSRQQVGIVRSRVLKVGLLKFLTVIALQTMKLVLNFFCLIILATSISGCAIHTPRTILKNDLILDDKLRQITSVTTVDGSDLKFSSRSGIYSGQRKEITGTSERGGSIIIPISLIVSCDISPASGILTIGAYFFGIVGAVLIVLLIVNQSSHGPPGW